MRNVLLILAAVCITAMIAGCGHNAVHYGDGIGFDAGINPEEAEITRKPDTTVEIKDVKTAEQVLRVVDRLEELDDVQSVTANFEIDDEIADQLEA